MKMSTTTALYWAGAIILSSAIISQFDQLEPIVSIIFVVLAIVFLFLGFAWHKERKSCTKKNEKRRVLGVDTVVLWTRFCHWQDHF